HRAAARKLPPRAAQPRPALPRAVAVRARAAGLLRQLHGLHAGARKKQQRVPRDNPAALPAGDADPEPREPGRLAIAGWHPPRQPVLQARRLQRAAERRAAGVQLELLLEPGALGQRAAQRDGLPERDRTDHPVQSRQRAGNPQRRARPRLQPAGPVHVQRPDRAVPARGVRGEMMNQEQEEFQYHSTDLDLAGEGEGEWSIRCKDVHKRLGGVPVLNGLNVAIPDHKITVVLGPSGTGKSVLIKHVIGLMFPDAGDVVVHGQSVPSLTMPQLLALRQKIGVLFQDGALFGSMSVVDNVASARQIGQYIALLWRGRIVEAGDAERMFSSDNPFVHQFLSGSAEGPLTMD